MSETACKICAQNTSLIFDEQLEVEYYYCVNCRFISRDEEKSLSPEQEKQRYLLHNNTRADSGYVDMLNAFIEQSITPFHTGIETVLDFGSGPNPVLAQLLEEKGCRVDIYDIYFAPVEVYRDKTYDLIVCTEVIEHLTNPLAVLRLLREHLKPGGILAIMTLFHPVYERSSSPEQLPCERVFKEWWYRRDPTHISFFRPETFYYIAKLLDFTILMMDQRNTVSFQKC